KEFMRMLMPSHARNVKFYRDSQPVFTRFGIESQLDAMFSPTVQLRSGGYIVINQAEALVAIDVNSGRATREHHIEDTALKTNIEAAEEVARQLRLRDLAGLIVIDFIDMDEGRNNRTVERRLKEALKHDRARIQVGRISHFGLLEMSRQRIRTSVLESSTEKCPVCGGSGHVRSVSSVTLALLRSIEETLLKGATHNLIVRTRPEVALYILNHKRSHLRALEDRFQITIIVNADATVVGTQSFVIDRGEQVHTPEAARSIAAAASEQLPPLLDEEDEVYAETDAVEAEASTSEGETAASEPREDSPLSDVEESLEHTEGTPSEDGGHRRRRRRRGGRGRGRGRGGEPREHRDESAQPFMHETAAEHAGAHEDHNSGELSGEPGEEFAAEPQGQFAPEGDEGGDGGRRRRRRGRRGGRRNRHRRDDSGGYRDNAAAGQGGEAEFEGAYEHGGPGNNGGSSVPAYSAVSEPPTITAPVQSSTPSGEAVSETPRRRSTVREAAPTGQSWANASRSPAPHTTADPVVSSTGAEEPAQPKRGWWGKRLLGGKE
ncbi:MAG: ribonuclease E/G, partial [Pseudolabrys sp.]|nr:ribonuclease E/G [Pseudolabrys sp.]